MSKFSGLFLIGVLCLGCVQAETPVLKCKVLEEIQRSKKGYTQGFFIENGKLYESTGGYGSSLVRRFDLQTQEVEVSKQLPADIFGEGLTSFGENRMLQLTWKKGLGIVYQKDTVNILKTFRYKTEGWGITTQGQRIVMSDGSSTLYFLNPENFQEEAQLKVSRGGTPVDSLNELEWVGGHIYANRWLTDEIVKINAETGVVVATIDCSALFSKRPNDPEAVLNGIAYDFDEEVFYLTGKKWPVMYKVLFEPK